MRPRRAGAVALGAGPGLGRVLDAQRALAGADRPLALAPATPIPRTVHSTLLYFGLTALFWIGHRLSSTYLAYCTEAYRPLLRAQPVRFVVLPLVVTAGCFAVILPPDAALPWSRAERLVALAILDYVFVTYHFAAQHFGALSLYRGRVGRGACARARGRWIVSSRWASAAFWCSWRTSWPEPSPIRTAGSIAGSFPPGWSRRRTRSAPAPWSCCWRRRPRCCWSSCARRDWSLPRVLYVLGIAAMVALALRPRGLFLFLVLWTSQHWILATGLASLTPAGEPAPRRGAARRMLHGLNTRPWAILLLVVAASIVLLPLFEVEAGRQGAGAGYYGDRIFGAIATGLRTSSWVPALLALGFATGFVHYLLDRSVYRLSDPQVRAAAQQPPRAKRMEGSRGARRWAHDRVPTDGASSISARWAARH